jgi:transcriptional regulator with XRE-family HTH domain
VVTEASSPTVWRRWLAFELARLRREAGLDQKDVAKALRCTVGKVSYYETAERPVVVRDLDEVLLPLYNVPQQRWPLYLQAAKDSRQKGWWERYDANTLPSWFSLFVGLEQGASQIRIYEAQLIPACCRPRNTPRPSGGEAPLNEPNRRSPATSSCAWHGKRCCTASPTRCGCGWSWTKPSYVASWATPP